MRRTIPLILTFLVGMLPIFAFFVPHRVVSILNQDLDKWLVIVAAFALPLGVVNLVSMNVSKIKSGQKVWPYSIVLLVGLGVMVIYGLIGGDRGFHDHFQYPFMNMVSPLQATMFSLLAFFIASAAYRAFRARTLEATLMLVTAIVIMFARVPVGEFLWRHIMPDFILQWRANLPGDVSNWILNVPSMAARRGILLGVSLGAIATSLKIILGIERSYMGAGE